MMISLGVAVCVDGVITDGMFSLHLSASRTGTTVRLLLTPSLSLQPIFLYFLPRSALTDVRLRVTELLSVCLAEWIVSGHSTLCPAIKTVMMMLVRGCSIISYDDYHIILHHHSTDKLSLKIKVSPTSKRFFINIFIEC